LVDFTLNVPMETGMNTLQNRYKIHNFTLTVSSIAAIISAVWDDDVFLQCVRLCATFTESRPMFFTYFY